ncbi:4-hydroxy-tetrahydrodipicolinate synthase [Terribacillus saccharophilus]|uniref:4-hydroxy-tetrahydrodipicolinate synthase n=1 Tax=Terribacillus saccharophilus TaxID=361277 RepID=A0A268A6C1_9BACI|nr:4-hydroxy-tetrahydrodipicolinate synthase [Terribacillus saccharophilus]PAD19675.1 4-hydroxy-tetrahydrodipicolinate synthase [Terribacillus saccharophilus]PAF34661.1 4-hydroxy-tetrahydrodipicolinate synthase [Terribacillus saccharophilus]PAF35549.1 4-hydroxy-tetrahydrodipicolinate synthase [Terribacillus saccharophilus]
MNLTGIWPAMVTPFSADQRINKEAIQKLTNYLIEAGVHGLFALGTNGEFHMLDRNEKLTVAGEIIRAANGRVPVMVGTGGNSTKEVIELSRDMEALGADALSIITPYFVSPDQSELAVHYETIASAVTIPVMLYNIPSKTGMTIEAQTVARLAKHPNILGIKDSSGNFDNIQAYIDVSKNEEFAVFAGTDSLILQTLRAGGQGAVAATANVLPDKVLAIYHGFQDNDEQQAEEAQSSLQPLRDTFGLGAIPSSLKKAVELVGIPVGPPRLPVTEANGEVLQQIKNMMQEYNIHTR